MTMQQTSAQEAAVRADVAARVRAAVEQARAAQAEAQNAARQAQAEAQQAQAEAQQAQAEGRNAARAGVDVPPAPTRVIVRDGHVIVSDNIVGPPGATTQMPPNFPADMPPNVANVAYSFFLMIAVIAIGIPIVRVVGRWLERRTAVPPALPADVTQRLERIEQAVETVALEVERISEGQRFTSKLMAEMRQLPQLEGTRAEGVRIAEPRR